MIYWRGPRGRGHEKYRGVGVKMKYNRITFFPLSTNWAQRRIGGVQKIEQGKGGKNLNINPHCLWIKRSFF
jgi:hypothetical protein